MRATRIVRIAAAFLAAAALSWHAGSQAAVVQEVRVSFNPASITLDDTTNLAIEVKTSQGNIDSGMDVEVPLPSGLYSVGAMAFQDCFGATSVSTGTSVLILGLKSRPGKTCLMSIRIGASGVGQYVFPQGSIVVRSDGRSSGNTEAAILDVVAARPALLGSSHASLAFGPQLVGTPSAAQSVTLSNTGTGTLTIDGVTASGDFSVSGCASASLAPGGSCTISISFTPTTAGARAGAISVSSNATGSPHGISLSGTGTAPAVSLSPSPLAFGVVTAGSSSMQVMTLANTGSATLVIGSITASGLYFSAAPGCPSSLEPGASCSIAVTYAPAVGGTYVGQLAVVSNANPAVVALSGGAAAAPAPVLSLSASSLAFGSQAVGTQSLPQAVVVTNLGSAPLALAIDRTASGDFDVSGCATTSLAAGDSCALSISFGPTAGGPRPGSVQISSNAAGTPHLLALSGTGTTAPAIALSPTALEFGPVHVGSTTLLRVVIGSAGTEPLVISSIGVSGAGFSQTNLCPNALAPGASCDVWVAFAPQVTGTHAGSLIITSNVAGGSSTVALGGSGTPAPEPAVALSRSAIEFGAQTLGVASNAQAVLVSNTGNATLQILSIAAAGDFGFEGCATPLSLATGDSCELRIKFLPTATGARSGSVAISTNAAGSPHAIVLTGSGTPAPVPGIAIAPTAVDFGTIQAGSSVVTHLALTNTGTASLSITGISTSSPHFTHSSTCPPSLAPSAACEIPVTYAPSGEGSHSGELQVASNAVPSPLAVPLFGFATPANTPLVDLSSTSIAFPPLFVGQTSTPRTVTLLNYGLAPLRIHDIVSSGDFGYSGCGASTTLLTGESCVFSITFRPLSVGALAGAIEVRSNAPGSPHTISLAGNGVSLALPEIALAPANLSFGAQAVGASVTHAMTLTNAGGTALQISSISVSGSFFTQANDCPASLAVGSSCRITVTYAPTSIGAHNAQLVVQSNATPGSHVASLSGSATAVAPALLVVDRSVDFGETVVGTTGRETLQLTNAGGEPLVISSARTLFAPEFGVEGECTTLLPGARCMLDVTFTPTALGDFWARLDIVSNHATGVVQIPLVGEGVPRPRASLKLSVEGLGWGNQVVGTTGETRVVQVASTGGEALRIHSIDASPDFIVNATQCPALLEPKATCDIYVSFKPIVPGPRNGRLMVNSNAVGSVDSVSLAGIGCRFFTMGAARNPSRLCSP